MLSAVLSYAAILSYASPLLRRGLLSSHNGHASSQAWVMARAESGEVNSLSSGEGLLISLPDPAPVHLHQARVPDLLSCHLSPYEGPSGSTLQRQLQLSHTTSDSGQSISLLVSSQIAVSWDPDEGDLPPILERAATGYLVCGQHSVLLLVHPALQSRPHCQGAVPSFSLLQPLHCLPHCRGLGSVRATQRTSRSWPTVNQVIAPVYCNTGAPVLHSA